MSDGDHYDVCSCCGTEYLQRAMIRQTASGIYFCQRCDDFNRGVDTHPEEEDYDGYDDCPHCDGAGCIECDGTGAYA